MKNVRIIALHLSFGGIEKAIISMANLFAQKYNVEIISVYNMPGGPAFPIDERVKVRYLLKEVPNREEWKTALKERKFLRLIKESFLAAKILLLKRNAVIKTIKSIHDGVLICTRNADNVKMSKYGDKNVLKIAQFHEDHLFRKKITNCFKHKYGNIEYFALLTPGLAREVREMVTENKYTKIIDIPNFINHFPENVDFGKKEKTIFAIGRVEDEKGFDRLIRCFAEISEKVPDWNVKIAGDGTSMEKLKKLISELGLENRVFMLGRLSSDEVEQEMLKASVHSMTSFSEGFPFVLLEAGSCGLPTVAYDVRVGPAAVLTDGVDSFLVPDGDSVKYCEKLLKIIESKELREQMGRKSMEMAKRYSAENVFKIWSELIGD